jgi:Xaa-Pro aminopeptidase
MASVVRKSRAYLQVRQRAARAALRKFNVDTLLITQPSDLAYLTDFTGDDSVGLLTQKDFLLVSDFRYREQIQIEAPWLRSIMREGTMADSLADGLGELKSRNVGFQASRTTFGQIDGLKSIVKKRGMRKIEFSPLGDFLVEIRQIKDLRELGIIRQAVRVAEDAFRALRRQIRVGQDENFLAGLLVFEMRSRGASDGSFQTIVAAGANGSLPHYRPGKAKVRRGQPLLIDWGALYMGYCSDLTRTLLVGNVKPVMKDIYKIVLEAQMAAIDSLAPGKSTRDADKVARDIIDKAGYREHFGHGLGHGIGREIHELPVLRKTGTHEALRPGMIVTVEPGIYLPGIGGVRIEDDVLITRNGHEVLSSLNKTFEGCQLE